MGPGELTVGQLEVAWEVEGEWMMRRHDFAVGTRPWAWWWFDLGEEMPRGRDAEVLRLAELGELRPVELATLRGRANEARLRLGADAERLSGGNRETGVSLDQRRVALWDAVERVSRR